MDNEVLFDSDTQYRTPIRPKKESWSLEKVLVESGIAENAKQARTISFATIIICICIMGWVMIRSSANGPEKVELPPGQFIPE